MNSNHRLAFIILLITSVTISRLLPHPVNFTPLLAVALFAGRQIPQAGLGLVLVCLSMLVIDIPYIVQSVLPEANRDLISKIILINATVYATVLGLAAVAQMTRRRSGLAAIVISSLVASTIFFITTNLASWLAFYPISSSGLIACFTNALPFFKNTCLSTLFYSGVLFGCLSLMDRVIGVSLPQRRPHTNNP